MLRFEFWRVIWNSITLLDKTRRNKKCNISSQYLYFVKRGSFIISLRSTPSVTNFKTVSSYTAKKPKSH
jgi:hypothetical protein